MKNKLVFYLIIFLASGFIYAKCKKEDLGQCSGSCYNVTGFIKDSISGSGIAGLEIEIATIKSGSFPHFTGSYGTGVTDGLGKYVLYYPSSSVDFDKEHLLITVKAPAGFVADNTDVHNAMGYILKSDSPKIAVPIIANSYLFKKSFLDVRVLKVNPNNNLYSFGYNFGRAGYGNISSFPSTGNLDTTYHFETAAEVKTYISWKTKSGSVVTNFSDSVILQPGQTRNMLIQL